MKKIIAFLGESKEELSKIKWPTKEQVSKNTKSVILMSFGMAFFLGLLDFLFNLFIARII
jgi:preprotein translocase subunit SecE